MLKPCTLQPPADRLSAASSPARDAHMAGNRGPVVAPVDDEIVPLGLARDRFADRSFKRLIAFGLAQWRTQIRRVLLPQPHIERAGAGQADAAAALAEIMGQRRDKAEPPAGLAHGDVTRRAAGAVVAVIERPAALQAGAHQRQ